MSELTVDTIAKLLQDAIANLDHDENDYLTDIVRDYDIQLPSGLKVFAFDGSNGEYAVVYDSDGIKGVFLDHGENFQLDKEYTDVLKHLDVNLLKRLDYISEPTVDIDCLEEDTPVRGNAIASGDAAYDKQIEDEIIEDLDGNPWSWCTVRVTVELNGLKGVDYLGCCSYKSEQNFIDCDCFEDMKIEAIAELEHSLMQAIGMIKE